MRSLVTLVMTGLFLAAAGALAATSPNLGDSLPGSVQLAADFTAAQQQELDKIYAEAKAAAQGGSLADRQQIYRDAMPKLIETLRPGTKSTAYAKVIADSPAIRVAQTDLARSIGLTAGGEVPFYP